MGVLLILKKFSLLGKGDGKREWGEGTDWRVRLCIPEAEHVSHVVVG